MAVWPCGRVAVWPCGRDDINLLLVLLESCSKCFAVDDFLFYSRVNRVAVWPCGRVAVMISTSFLCSSSLVLNVLLLMTFSSIPG